ncbi:MAG TPA: hypothetical protein VFG99_06075 [Chloroflexia bacterium]|nr:hypothetical protein [Chloroflexia bacterium]
MAMILMKLIKNYQGEEFENTYGIITNGDALTYFNGTEDLDAAVGTNKSLSALNTDPTNAAFNPQNTIVQAIIGYERMLTASLVSYDRVYLSDGRQNPGTSVFWTEDLGYNGLWSPAGGVTAVAAGSIVLYIARHTPSMSVRSGRLMVRMALAENEVSPQGRGLVSWQDPAARNGVLLRESGARAQSGLEDFYSLTDPATNTVLGIPRYNSTGIGGQKGDVMGMAPISAMVVKYPTSRQVKRGRRRPTP